MVRKNKTLPLLSYTTNEYRSDETQFVEETVEQIFFKGCTKLWKCVFTSFVIVCSKCNTHCFDISQTNKAHKPPHHYFISGPKNCRETMNKNSIQMLIHKSKKVLK